MTNTQKIQTALAPIAGYIRYSWDVIKYDVGNCTRSEMAELALDRLEGPAGQIVDDLIATYGYKAVENVVANQIL